MNRERPVRQERRVGMGGGERQPPLGPGEGHVVLALEVELVDPVRRFAVGFGAQ